MTLQQQRSILDRLHPNPSPARDLPRPDAFNCKEAEALSILLRFTSRA